MCNEISKYKCCKCVIKKILTTGFVKNNFVVRLIVFCFFVQFNTYQSPTDSKSCLEINFQITFNWGNYFISFYLLLFKYWRKENNIRKRKSILKMPFWKFQYKVKPNIFIKKHEAFCERRITESSTV